LVAPELGSIIPPGLGGPHFGAINTTVETG